VFSNRENAAPARPFLLRPSRSFGEKTTPLGWWLSSSMRIVANTSFTKTFEIRKRELSDHRRVIQEAPKNLRQHALHESLVAQ